MTSRCRPHDAWCGTSEAAVEAIVVADDVRPVENRTGAEARAQRLLMPVSGIAIRNRAAEQRLHRVDDLRHLREERFVLHARSAELFLQPRLAVGIHLAKAGRESTSRQ